MSVDGGERVTLGYFGGTLLPLLAFANLGTLLVLLSPFAIVLHRLAARDTPPTVASHHRFLARTWGGALVVYLLLYALLLLPLLLAFQVLEVALQAAAAADPGAVLPTVLTSLQAYLSTAPGWPVATAVLLFVVHGLASLIIATWLAVRLIRRWLRWSDRLPA
jgi:hypothetical protein